jgi:hypothetical protein
MFRLLLALLANGTTTNDQLVARKVWLAGAALCLTPRCYWVTTSRGLTFTTTVWVINRVHGYTTNGRANALPAHAASLTPVDVGLLCVANFTDGCTATCVYVTDFTRWQTKLREGAILGD